MYPRVHPAPMLVTQDPARCWSAAYEAWNQANAAQLGLPIGPTQESLIAWFSDRFATRAGRATDDGVRLLAGISFMRLQRLASPRVTAEVIDRALKDGYVYCAYYWNARRGGRNGHAVVIYGQSAGSVFFLDPAPGRGLVKESVSFFARESVEVVLGVSMLTGLRRDLRSTLSQLG